MRLDIDSAILNQNTYDARDTFSDVFQALLEARSLPQCLCSDSEAHGKQLADRLGSLVESKAESLYLLQRDEAYSRHVIGTDDDWIGFICRWEPQVKSSIHGHPSFAYYQVLEGVLSMSIYDAIDDTNAQQVSEHLMHTRDCIWESGKTGTYDNLIHRVETLDKQGFTLHLFSENPAKGKVFQTIQ